MLAFQALYAWEAGCKSLPDLLEFRWVEPEKLANYAEEQRAFSALVLRGAVERIDEIDASIRANLVKWDFDRLSRVDLAILRMSAYALLFQRDIPASVTIDEAVEIAREYGSEESYKFVNGVLDAIRKGLDG